jgi:hypothetical protein
MRGRAPLGKVHFRFPSNKRNCVVVNSTEGQRDFINDLGHLLTGRRRCAISRMTITVIGQRIRVGIWLPVYESTLI